MEKKEEQLARLFHNTYERLAPEFGYTTRGDTKQFDKNSPNGKLMVAVCREVMIEELDKAREEGFDSGVEKTVNIIQEGLDELLLEKDGEKYWVGDILRDCGSSVEKMLPQNMKHYKSKL